MNPERPAYVPPHLRNRPAAPPAAAPFAAGAPAPHVPAPNGVNGYRPQQGLPTPAPTPVPTRSAYVPPSLRNGAPAVDDGGWGAPKTAAPQSRGFSSGGGDGAPGYGVWRNGHVLGQRNMRMEKELYGEEGDGVHQVSA